MHTGDDVGGLLRAPPSGEGEGLLTGTPVFEALFAALELAAPAADLTSLELLLGSGSSPFG